MCKFSIITVSYNAENLIGDTLSSTLNQSYGDFEIIIKDGCSTDNTLDNIPNDERITLIREKDSGIYDAMNQAIMASHGEYLIFMNCGDLFYDSDVLKKVADNIDEGQYKFMYGDFCIGKVPYIQPDIKSDFYIYKSPLCHQSMIIPKKFFDNVGYYDTKYKILADYDFTVRCWKNEIGFKHIDVMVCSYLSGGVSESKQGKIIREKERRLILNSYFDRGKCFVYDLILAMSLRSFRIWLCSDDRPEWIKKIYRSVINIFNH